MFNLKLIQIILFLFFIIIIVTGCIHSPPVSLDANLPYLKLSDLNDLQISINCNDTYSGMIIYNNTNFYGCNSTSWVILNE